MRKNAIRISIVLGILATASILAVQVYLFKTNLDLREKQLSQSIQIALRNVAEILSGYQNSNLPYGEIVKQQSPDYYVVNVNDIIDAQLLEHYLIKEFEMRNLKLDFEYAIYDCFTDQMVYGHYVQLSDINWEDKLLEELPKYDEYIYYFGIHFPSRTGTIMHDMRIWYFLTAILLLALLFFGYTQMIILKQRRMSEIQKDFIDNLTHEFKTPISSLKLAAEVLSEDGIHHEPQRIKSYAKIIGNQSQSLLDQVEHILFMTKTDNYGIRLKKEKFDLNEVIQFTVDLTATPVANKAEIRTDLDPDLPLVYGDKDHLQNVLFNLIDNSIKYNHTNPVVKISSSFQKGHIDLSVEDNGIGIEKKQQGMIFKKFYRVPTGNVHNVKGFGLGLSYVKRVVQLHGWKIKLESQLGVGTKISIKI